MCGITGIFHHSRTSDVKRRDIERMTASLAHRGPNGEGYHISSQGKVALGHRRLSIIDLSNAGRQPMSTPDGRYHLVYNGEIYNHADLRRDLIQRGYSYHSDSDSETLLYAFTEWGPKCLERLRGMFAFAVWDESRDELFMARDRIGVKPLYFAEINGALIFASEIKALLTHSDISAELNPEALYHYLTLAAAPAPQTMFKGIYKLPAGFSMQIRESGSRTLTRWWDADLARPVQSNDENEIAHNIRDLLRESIKLRMISDVPFGVFLSGGLDSTTNVALMSELMDRPVQTFSVGIKGGGKHNEFLYARQVAKHYGCDHREIQINDDDFIGFLEDMPYHQDEPLADPVCVPLFYVSRLARDSGVPVIQVGEGSDELFCGYPKFKLALRLNPAWNALQSLPTGLWRAGYRISASMLEKRGQLLTLEHLRRLGNRERLFWGGAMAFMEYQKRLLLSNNMLESCGDISTAEFIESVFENGTYRGPDSFLRSMTYLELKQRLPELLLMRVDKMAMANSIETRVPFLDHKLVEYALTLPAKLQVKNGTLKYLLKKAVRGIVPDDIIDRKKLGFCGSAKNMLSDRVAEYSYDLIYDAMPELDGVFNQEYLKRVMYLHQKGDNQGMRLWNLLNFALWHRRFISKRVTVS